ncbi:MAG: tryptophan 2,3-dioxygenase family protein [Bacteroidia bacterium]|nr:tryptophan 2,3-dioxygenase family protein [Bacteroidia bacterium]MDW8347743.1 tryptophan 2,3-dioxygenase family protein [Bacteroidia bacterium]
MLTPEITEKIEALNQKYALAGQDLGNYLEGLLYADYLSYWDYIELDTLLTLQKPKTLFPDEKVFIIYHQITELYFNLILHELAQIFCEKNPTQDILLKRTKRINSYISHLIHSFEVMIDGMDKEQFLKFRMSLLPASGFQSAQFRKIEIACTPLVNLIHTSQRAEYQNKSLEEQYKVLYWKYGAIELKTGEKTLTLRLFEQKYEKEFIDYIYKHKENTLYEKYLSIPAPSQELKQELRILDQSFNIHWCLMHYKSAVKYLHKSPEDIKATGGTNWQQYLPPKFQRIIFFPCLWSDIEQQEWGKNWVAEQIQKLNSE